MSLFLLLLVGLLGWMGLALLVGWIIGRAAQLGQGPDEPHSPPERASVPRASSHRDPASQSDHSGNAPPDRLSSA